MKKFFSLATAVLALGVCLLSAPAKAAPPAYFQAPQPSTPTGMAIMWIAGQIEVHRSTNDKTSIIIIGSTSGVNITYGLIVTTAQVTGLLTGVNANFSSWVKASTGNYTGVVQSSSVIAGVVTATGAIVFADGTQQTTAASGQSIGNTTFTITMSVENSLYLATATPAVSDFMDHGTFTVTQITMYVDKPSSMTITKAQLVYSTSSATAQGDPPVNGQYGFSYVAISPEVVIGTQAVMSVNLSCTTVIPQDCRYGIRITTVTDSRSSVAPGFPAEGLRAKLRGWMNPN